MSTKRTKKRGRQLEDFDSRWLLLASELEGLYLEVDKLSKKTPAARISDLELQSVNNLVGMIKEFLVGDPFIDRVVEFVPAGENPEYREALLVLRQMIQGMNRKAPQFKAIRT